MWIALITRHDNEYAEAAGFGKTEDEAVASAMAEAADQIEALDGEDPAELVQFDLDEGNLTLTKAEV